MQRESSWSNSIQFPQLIHNSNAAFLCKLSKLFQNRIEHGLKKITKCFLNPGSSRAIISDRRQIEGGGGVMHNFACFLQGQSQSSQIALNFRCLPIFAEPNYTRNRVVFLLGSWSIYPIGNQNLKARVKCDVYCRVVGTVGYTFCKAGFKSKKA